MFNDDEDPKKPHEPFHPKKGGPTPFEEDGDPWRHCKGEQRKATPRSASQREFRRHV